jgi:hypothetical protein
LEPVTLRDSVSSEDARPFPRLCNGTLQALIKTSAAAASPTNTLFIVPPFFPSNWGSGIDSICLRKHTSDKNFGKVVFFSEIRQKEGKKHPKS